MTKERHTPPILEAHDITKTYGDTIAIENITMSLWPGECLALLGPNGAGKTTTCEILEGLVKPDSGRIRLFSKDLSAHRREILQDVGIHIQDTVFYGKYTVRETLELFASFYRRVNSKTATDRVCSEIGLTEILSSRIGKLSGGQKQRVFLACALIHEPKLLFLDEPSTGLDPHARRELWKVVDQYRSMGGSVLLTTHNLEEAEYLADEIAILDRGKIIRKAPTETLRAELGDQQLLSFKLSSLDGLIHTNEMTDLLAKQVPWFTKVKVTGDKEFRLKTNKASVAVSELVRSCDKFNIKVDNLTLKKASLEDIYLQLTNRSSTVD